MADKTTQLVKNCFFNAAFHVGSPDGPSKFCWGVKELDLSKDIQTQILRGSEYESVEIFSFNLTALNEVALLNNVGAYLLAS